MPALQPSNIRHVPPDKARTAFVAWAATLPQTDAVGMILLDVRPPPGYAWMDVHNPRPRR